MEQMKISLFLSLLTITGTSLFCQHSQTIHSDTLLAREFLSHAQGFLNKSNFDSALIYYERAAARYHPHVQGSADTVLWKGYLRCRNYIGDCLRIRGQYELSLAKASETLELGLEHIGLLHPELADSYNNFGLIYIDQGDFLLAAENFQKTLDIRIKVLGPQHVKVAMSYSNLGVAYNGQKDYRLALAYYQRALPVIIAVFGEDHPNVSIVYNGIGGVYWRQGAFDQALEMYHKAIGNRIQAFGENNPTVATLYSNLGGVYYSKGAYVQARENHHKALEIRMKILGEQHPSVGVSHNNIGLAHFGLKDYDAALDNYQKALPIFTSRLGPKHPSVAWTYNNIAEIHDKRQSYSEAIDYFFQALDIRINAYGENHSDVAMIYHNLGVVYYNLQSYSEALSHYEKALKIYQEVFGEHHPHVATGFHNIGTVYLAQNKYQQALDAFQHALRANVIDFEEEEISQNPTITDVVLSDRECITSLRKKAEALHKRYLSQATSLEDVLLAQETYQVAIDFIDKTRNSYKRTEDKADLLAYTLPIYEGSLAVNKLLAEKTGNTIYLEQAFMAAERGKHSLLTESLRHSEALRFSGIPDSVLQFQQQLELNLANAARILSGEQSRGIELDSAELLRWQEEHFSLNRSRDSLLQHMELVYPRYFQLKYDHSTVPIDVLQSWLQDSTALLEYFWGDSNLYAFLITAEDIRIWEQPYESLPQELSEMRETLSSHKVPLNDAEKTAQFDDFTNRARQLYLRLFAPYLGSLNAYKDLIIIPDGPLGYLAFDVLLAEEVPKNALVNLSYEHLPFLLKSHQLRYGYSSTLLLEKAGAVQSTQSYAGFAPSYSSDPTGLTRLQQVRDVVQGELAGFTNLTHNQSEIQLAASLFGGEQFLGTQATLNQFQQHAPDHQILHLAMHAFVNDSLPLLSGLVFASTKDTGVEQILFGLDLYNMNLNADLTILSACQTGYGKIQRGEGIMSLARAFKYAGCPNILMTLWSADDQASGEIVSSFLRQLKSGEEKDEALRQAKLDYLKHGDQKHPFFWANFVLLGDDAPFYQMNPLWGILIALILLIIGGISWQKVRSNKKNETK